MLFHYYYSLPLLSLIPRFFFLNIEMVAQDKNMLSILQRWFQSFHLTFQLSGQTI